MANIEEPEQRNFSHYSLTSPDSGTGSTLVDSGEEENGENGSSTPAVAAKREQRPNRCAVCNRKAKCCHFNVPSCLGCRSFFRRSVLQQRHYQCQQGGKCRIHQGEICRSCRLDRCILAGMSGQCIQLQSEPDSLREALDFFEERRTKLLDKNNAKAIIKSEPSAPGGVESKLLESLLYVDDKLLQIRYSETEIDREYYAKKGLQNILEQGQSILAKSTTFSANRCRPLSFDYYTDQIDEKGNFGVNKPNWLFIDSFLLLEMAKTMPVVRQLSLQDQMNLLASNTLASMVFSQSYYTLLMDGDWQESMTFPNGFSPLCFRRNKNVMPMKMRLFCHYLGPYKRVGMTREEFLLLRSITMLHTASANLSKFACDLLQAELANYTRTLMQYEQRRLGHATGAQRYAELMFFHQSVHRFGYEHQKFLMYMSTVLDVKLLLSHPDFMDNVVFGIAGKILNQEGKRNTARAEEKMPDYARFGLEGKRKKNTPKEEILVYVQDIL